MIKVGKYTAALILVAVGGLLLADFTMKTDWTAEIARWWPAVFILLGIEYLIVSSANRNSESKIGLAFGSLALSVVLAFGVISFTQASNLGILNIAEFGWNAIAKEGEPQRKDHVVIPLGSERTLKITNPYGALVLKSGNVNDIEIDTTIYVPAMSGEEAEDIAAKSEIVHASSGGTLEVTAKGARYRVFLINQRTKMNMVVTVPHERIRQFDLQFQNGGLDIENIAAESITGKTTNGAIGIRSVSGNVELKSTNGTIRAEHITGDIKLDTTNGALSLRDVQGSVEAETTNGDVDIDRVSGNAEADSTNGRLRLNNIAGKLDAETTNGGITVEAQAVGGEWSLENTNGAVIIRLPKDAAFDVRSKAGSFTSDFAVDGSGKTVNSPVNGGGPRINIETNSGVQLQYAN